MKLEDQVLTIEQAKHLQKLGLDMSDAAFTWHTNLYTKDTHLGTGYLGRRRSVYTYTLQETLSKLPGMIVVDNVPYFLGFDIHRVILHYSQIDLSKKCLYSYGGKPDLKDCAYDTLCWVLENGYLKEEAK